MKEFFESVQKAIPRLQRHAWLLTGSREAAADYAELWLERMIHQQNISARDNNPVSFFRTFHDFISQAEIGLDADQPHYPAKIKHELLLLPVDQRTAVLLVYAEGFTRAEAASIMRLEFNIFSQRLALGRAILKSHASAPVFIIEDEPIESMNISRMIEEFGHNVCGASGDAADAKTAIKAAQPQLILSDVQLGNSAYGGIELCEELSGQYELPVVYVTGYPERVRETVRRDTVLIVAKPFAPETLRTAMGLALSVMA